MKAHLQDFFNVRREEILPVLLAVLFFFCILTALMLLRPAREALGMQRGIELVRWLFIGTAVVTLLVNPLFGLLVSRLKRMQFISITYVFFALSLVGFYLVMMLAPEAIGVTSGQVFYVWFSVFNLFVTMVFWALMADRFSLAQSKRFFGLIAVGGTCGAIFGPWLASQLATPLGTPALLLISAGFLLLALLLAWMLTRLQPRPVHGQTGSDEAAPAVDENALIGGSAWEGFRAVFRSRYLLGIAAYVIILAIMATFIYFTRLQMVAALGDDLDLRTTWFARIDLITQITTLVLQGLVAGHLMRRIGVPITLALLPITTLLGFVGLALVGSLAALIAFEAAFRAVQRAIMRPARETLYTVTSREDKYKSKAFIDTFVYRSGDVVGAQLEGALGRLGMGLAAVASVAVPLALIWAALALWLGRTQQQLAESTLSNPDNPSSLKGA
ncbi:NTP/NDP exchange transporter [Marinospirillum alkaliphilum]|uniref:ATP:ADP antiporter, AAA family n=1 Tax=Marinospirillum alkaliphilum DSM 21637 TaxID=1122209 RepID=A0A1K1YUS9_9GAMM|nr:MFS transporter [Marinospirillum alkaliphilum]SFX65203.1 ATP:ADP antiporter, AAA family [Marinospirillum alkaliphilum DSM 21637]